jgi:hypothetical protein
MLAGFSRDSNDSLRSVKKVYRFFRDSNGSLRSVKMLTDFFNLRSVVMLSANRHLQRLQWRASDL